jgi:hypothetical protein
MSTRFGERKALNKRRSTWSYELDGDAFLSFEFKYRSTGTLCSTIIIKADTEPIK